MSLSLFLLLADCVMNTCIYDLSQEKKSSAWSLLSDGAIPTEQRLKSHLDFMNTTVTSI